MAEYIKKEDAAEAMWRILNGMGYSQKHNDKLVEEVDAVLDEYTAADVRPVVLGKWKLGGYEQISDATEKLYDKYLQVGFLYCSVCKGRASVQYNFCPNCGAMMEES